MIERARKAFNEGRLLDEFIPVPEDLKIVAGTVGPKGSPEQDALEAQEKINRAKHGYTTWYDFCVNEWGTKWDVGADGQEALVQDANHITLNFDSAWSPPIGAYERLVEMGFSIRAMYYEPGMCFAGIWEDGHDDYYEYSTMTSEEVAAEFPPELDECFCISESMAEWEAENEEE
jgi:hypothetical protein